MKPVEAPVVSVPVEHEQLVVQTGHRTGLTMAVAVHSTALGPALGGARLWHYASPDEGICDALRLARGMTLKAAAAGLDLGGGKGVICAPGGPAPSGSERRAILHDFGDLVESLGGVYITAEDVGTAPEDMVEIATRTRHVTGLPVSEGGAGDPSPFTAIGVQAAMRAACHAAFGSRDLARMRVVVTGVGHVGERLAKGVAEAGAELVLSDVDPRKQTLADQLGARWVEPEDALGIECDVLAPCAVGGAIDGDNIDALRCRVVCGAANNQLADEALAESLASRDIVYAPDFIANAGGLINVYREVHAFPVEQALRLAFGIEETMGAVLARATREGRTPLEAAHALAQERLDLRSAR